MLLCASLMLLTTTSGEAKTTCNLTQGLQFVQYVDLLMPPRSYMLYFISSSHSSVA